MNIYRLDMTPTERAAKITFDLMRGQQLTSREISERYDITISGAHRLINRISRCVPIVYDDNGGVWRLIEPEKRMAGGMVNNAP